MLRTRLTELLGLRYPIVSAPMNLKAGGLLAATVSEAGGLGLVGAGQVSVDWLRAEVQLAREYTSSPFGVGFITHFIPENSETFAAALEERLAVYTFSFADPAPYLAQVRAVNATTICQVQTLAQAERAAELGAHVLAVQGNEAGGHTGQRALLPFLAQVLQRLPETIVIAAGGIGDGRSLAAVLAAGADGAWVGTPFVASLEAAGVPDAYKRRIVESDGADSVYTEAYDVLNAVRRGQARRWPAGIAGRALRTPFVDEWHGREDELRAQFGRSPSAFDDAAGQPTAPTVPFWAGPSAAAVTAVRSAADIVRGICNEAEQLLATRPRQILG